MLPTRATVLLLLFSLVLIPAGILFAPVRWLVFGYDGGILLLLLADAILAFMTYRPEVLRVRREKPPRLSLGTPNEVVVILENMWTRPLQVIVRDEPPLGFQTVPVASLPPLARVPPHGTVRLSYQIVPRERGNFKFGDIYLRCRGPMGLAWIDRTV